MKTYRIPVFLFLLLIFSCTSSETQKKEDKTTVQVESYPSLPKEGFQELLENAISIDVIAYKMGLSMTFGDKTSIHRILSFMQSMEPGQIHPQCQSAGRMSFMYEGGLGMEAEMYIHNGCRTLVWLDNGKKTYSNLLSQEGSGFINQFFPEDIKDLKLPKQDSKEKK